MPVRPSLQVLVYAPASVPFYDGWVAELERRRGELPPGVALRVVRSYEAVLEHLPEADVFVGSRLDGPDLRRAPRLRWIHAPQAGVEELLSPELVASDVELTNSRGAMAAPVAEHVLALLLYFARGLDLAVEGQRRRAWRLERPGRRWEELGRQTLGLVGFGAIGREVARRARCLGMRILAVRRHPHPEPALADAVWPPGELPRLLGEADYVVLAVPATGATERLVGEEELRRMKPGAFLVNVARGSVVDSAALARALREGWIAGAALDVFEEEPLPPESPFWELPNLLITPHTAAFSPSYWPQMADRFLLELRRFLAGEPLENRVSKTAGY